MSIVVSEYELEESKDHFADMFENKGKLARILPAELLERYKKTYYKLREMRREGKLPVHQDYLNGSELATNIYKKKYYLKNIDGRHIEFKPEDVFLRIASFVSSVEKNEKDAEKWAVAFYIDLFNSLYIPGGRVLAGAGDLYRLKTLANCFATIIREDSIEAIYGAAYEAARTYSYGGGIGIDISCLRPKDAVVHNAADNSTGAVSFMDLYSLTTGLIGQSGRRGALMLTIDVKHPDIIDFIGVKSNPNWITQQIVEQARWSGMFDEKQLDKISKIVADNVQIRFANISIKVSDEFMQALTEQSKYGSNAYVVYRKKAKGKVMDVYQDCKSVHYSYGIPSKNLKDYELVGTFESLDKLNDYLVGNYSKNVIDEEINDPVKRDVYGDYVIELDADYDLAVRKSGDFLLYFGSEETGSIKRLVKARDVWNRFVESNYKTAEPGLIFWSTMAQYSPSNYIGRPIGSTNPCAEVPLEDGGACNLASLNLSMFVLNGYTEDATVDWEKLRVAVHNVVRFLDNVVSWNELLNPLEKQRRAAAETRRVGLGVIGIADALNQMGVAYDSDKGLEIVESIMRFIANCAYVASADLAKEKGKARSFEYEKYSKNPFFKTALDESTREAVKKNGLRNIALLSIAPTGTISNIAVGFCLNGKNYIGVSSGIEPVFALYYTRRSESFNNQVFKVFHPTVQAYIDFVGLDRKVKDASNEDELRKILPEYFFRTAHVVDYHKRIRIQAVCQKYVDHSISSTVNLPEDIHPEIISNIYVEAWKSGLKGITIYRDGSRYPILSIEGKKSAFQSMSEKKYKVRVGSRDIIAKGSDVIVMPDNRLTTVYHLIKGEDEVRM
ncbi:MAG: adenosylcobalamin-dependent ribonucleoside-diphosphate reductase [Candidatus Micrarchaeia archaeon]